MFRSTRRYYGILQVVREVACALEQLQAGMRFVVYSPTHGRFFEIDPECDRKAPNRLFGPGMPDIASPIWLRQKPAGAGKLGTVTLSALRPLVTLMNLARWQAASSHVRKIDLTDGILISMGRPRMIRAYLPHLERDGCDVELHALLHDLFPLHYQPDAKAQAFAAEFLDDTIEVIRHASGLLANSHFTHDDLASFSGNAILPPLPPTSVIPLAHEHPETGEPSTLRIPDEPYLLSVGALVGRKNLDGVIAAMDILRARGRPVPKLVLAGARRSHVQQFLRQPRYRALADRVEIVADPNQTDLARLYRGALALVIASRMEGWGLPAGEALWHGTPVICSTAPALCEACGDLADYFDPEDPAGLARLIDRIATDPDHARALRARIAEARPSLRLWRDVAQDTLEAVGALPAEAAPSREIRPMH